MNDIESIKSMLNDFMIEKLNQCEKFEITEKTSEFCQDCNISTEERGFYIDSTKQSAIEELQSDLVNCIDQDDVENAHEKFISEIEVITDYEYSIDRIRRKYTNLKALLERELPTTEPVKITKKKRRRKL